MKGGDVCYQKQVRCTQKSFIIKILQKVNHFFYFGTVLETVLITIIRFVKEENGDKNALKYTRTPLSVHY